MGGRRLLGFWALDSRTRMCGVSAWLLGRGRGRSSDRYALCSCKLDSKYTRRACNLVVKLHHGIGKDGGWPRSVIETVGMKDIGGLAH